MKTLRKRSKPVMIQWFTGDWLADEALTRCEAATRGIWFDWLNHMHRRDDYELRDSLKVLAKLARVDWDEALDAVLDLAKNRAAEVAWAGQDDPAVAPKTCDKIQIVTVLSRRLHREWNERKSGRERKLRERERKASATSRPIPASSNSNSSSIPNSNSNTSTNEEQEQTPLSPPPEQGGGVGEHRPDEACPGCGAGRAGLTWAPSKRGHESIEAWRHAACGTAWIYAQAAPVLTVSVNERPAPDQGGGACPKCSSDRLSTIWRGDALMMRCLACDSEWMQGETNYTCPKCSSPMGYSGCFERIDFADHAVWHCPKCGHVDKRPVPDKDAPAEDAPQRGGGEGEDWPACIQCGDKGADGKSWCPDCPGCNKPAPRPPDGNGEEQPASRPCEDCVHEWERLPPTPSSDGKGYYSCVLCELTVYGDRTPPANGLAAKPAAATGKAEEEQPKHPYGKPTRCPSCKQQGFGFSLPGGGSICCDECGHEGPQREFDQNEPKAKKKGGRKPRAAITYSADFERLWAKWAEKVAKGQASRKFDEVSDQYEDFTVEGVIAQAVAYQAWCKAKERPLKHLATWLHNKGWDDDYTITDASDDEPLPF